MPGSSTVLQSAETTFQQDLNGDGAIGVPTTVIEAFGSTSLTAVGNTYHLYNGGAGPALKFQGSPVVAGQIPYWSPIGAEQIAGGYQVVWKLIGGDQYTLWTTDNSGNFVSFISAMPGSSAVLKSAETTFHQDLNGDGVIGVPSSAGPAAGKTFAAPDPASQVVVTSNDKFHFAWKTEQPLGDDMPGYIGSALANQLSAILHGDAVIDDHDASIGQIQHDNSLPVKLLDFQAGDFFIR
jgi:hypothetical protein